MLHRPSCPYHHHRGACLLPFHPSHPLAYHSLAGDTPLAVHRSPWVRRNQVAHHNRVVRGVKSLRLMLSLSAFQEDLCPCFGPARVLGKKFVVVTARSSAAYCLAAHSHQTTVEDYSSRSPRDDWRRPSAVRYALVLPLVTCEQVSRLRSRSVVDCTDCYSHKWTYRPRQYTGRRSLRRLRAAHMKVVHHGVLRRAGILDAQACPTVMFWCKCLQRTTRDTGHSIRLSSLQVPWAEVGPVRTVSSMVRRTKLAA
jgi:hypothetical protein